MVWDPYDVKENEKAIITRITDEIHKRDLDRIAFLVLETIKPMSYIGTQMGRLFLFPFIPIFSDEVELNVEQIFRILEKRENVEILLKNLEQNSEKDSNKKEDKKSKITNTEKNPDKKGWKRFIPSFK